MKITDVKTILLTGPCTNDRFLTESRKLRSAAFIEIHTDENVIGLGETMAVILPGNRAVGGRFSNPSSLPECG